MMYCLRSSITIDYVRCSAVRLYANVLMQRDKRAEVKVRTREVALRAARGRSRAEGGRQGAGRRTSMPALAVGRCAVTGTGTDHSRPFLLRPVGKAEKVPVPRSSAQYKRAPHSPNEVTCLRKRSSISPPIASGSLQTTQQTVELLRVPLVHL